MTKRLVITLSEEATAKWLALAAARTKAEVDEDCEPSGSSLLVDIHPLLSDCSYYREGELTELGEVDAVLTDGEYLDFVGGT